MSDTIEKTWCLDCDTKKLCVTFIPRSVYDYDDVALCIDCLSKSVDRLVTALAEGNKNDNSSNKK